MAKVNIYFLNNIDLTVKAQAHYLWNLLACFTRDSIIHYIYNVTEFQVMMSDSKC